MGRSQELGHGVKDNTISITIVSLFIDFQIFFLISKILTISECFLFVISKLFWLWVNVKDNMAGDSGCGMLVFFFRRERQS